MRRYLILTLLLGACITSSPPESGLPVDGPDPDIDTGSTVSSGTVPGWDPVDETCVAPTEPDPFYLDCFARHLGLASESPRGACSDHDDCPSGEFCGAGQCRNAAVEVVTVCLDKSWVTGPSWFDGPPDLAATWHGVPAADLLPSPAIRTATLFDTCEQVWNACQLWPLASVPGSSLAITEWAPDRRSGVERGRAEIGLDLEGAIEAVDAGCHDVTLTDVAGEPTGQMSVSIWYP